jgi:hypothetical protein
MQGETILCIEEGVWHSLWRDAQQIMSRIARHNRVLFFETGAIRTGHTGRAVAQGPYALAPQAQEVHPKLVCDSNTARFTLCSSAFTCLYATAHEPQVARINAQMLTRHIHWR